MTIKSSAAWHAWLRFSDRPHEVQDQEQDLPLAKATARQRCHPCMHILALHGTCGIQYRQCESATLEVSSLDWLRGEPRSQ